MDKGLERELEQYDWEVKLEWEKQDKEDANTDWDKIQEDSKHAYAEALNGWLGKDIDNVLSGKVKVKLPWRMRLKRWLEQMFKLFS